MAAHSTPVPYGAWPSPVTPEIVGGAVTGLDQVRFGETAVYWLERRPLEGGRQVVVACDGLGARRDVTGPELSVRTLVHEYGGGDYTVHGDVVYCANFADQRIYRIDDRATEPITPESSVPCGDRYADMAVSPDGRRLYCVRERHLPNREPVNEIVVLPTDGSQEPRVVAAGHDFCAAPRLRPDGGRLAWLAWDHPGMPWDATVLYEAPVLGDGTLGEAHAIAGGAAESVQQPAYRDDGVLHYVSDRSGWWNLYRAGACDPILAMDAEFGGPQWGLDLSTYGFLDDGGIACAVTSQGFTRVGVIRETVLRWLDLDCTDVRSLRTRGGDLALVAAGTYTPMAVRRLAGLKNDEIPHDEILAKGLSLDLDPGLLAEPESIAFPTADGAQAHALYYPPRGTGYEAPTGELPPLIVSSHGGPTGRFPMAVSLERLYWTSRGFGVIEVNYRGSTGYGRAYREALDGQWGIADVEDCIAAARWLAERGAIDPARIAVRGGSAGGYTTLCALAFHDFFAAGVSRYGVGDLAALARDTHKFESRYFDRLIGPWPQAEALYHERSPALHASGIRCPVLLLQGLEDAVVPPAQAEQMAAALRERGVPHAYLAFAGEQHGFRKAATIKAALEAELSFYAQIFGFTPADDIPLLPLA